MVGGTAYDRAIGERLRKLRESRGWSGDQLAANCKERLTSSQISKLELGKQQFTARLLHILADALGVQVWELLADHPLTPEETAILTQIRELPEDDRDTIKSVVDAFARPVGDAGSASPDRGTPPSQPLADGPAKRGRG